MIVNRLVLENFGAFRGRHEIDLRPKGSSPIVLFGGKNGAGKTTVFEATRVCLYGQNALPGRPRRADYEQFLVERIHRNNSLPIQPTQAATEIEFEHAHLGRVSKYTIRRSWERRTNGANEGLVIFRDGAPIEDLDADQWEDFIKELIPLGISQLFFFDGERIEQLAAQGTDAEQFRDSLRSLLGLDLVERLQNDLAIYIARQKRHEDPESVEHKLVLANEEAAQLEAIRIETLRTRGRVQNEYDQIRTSIEREEAKLRGEGGSFASKHEQLKAKAERLDTQISEVEGQLRELATGLLPFALAPEYLGQLESRLLEEAEISRLQSARDFMKEAKVRAIKQMKQEAFWAGVGLRSEAKRELSKRFSGLLAELGAIDVPSELVHPCSDSERAKLLSWIAQARTEIPIELARYTERLEKLNRDRQSTEAALRKAPAQDVLRPLVERLNELNKSLGIAETQLRHLDEANSVTEFKLNAAKRRVTEFEEELARVEGLSNRVVTAAKVRGALDRYLERVTEVKLRELSEALADAFSRLSNKPGYYSRVEIDPRTFATTVYNRQGDRVARDQMSAGERQVFATALLWALAKTSGRPLPFIIDTPLGRLDHTHRRNLVERFFPQAAHQVIILSTDSEIEEQYYDLLAPHVSHAYTIQYDHEAGESTLTPGYAFAKARLKVTQ